MSVISINDSYEFDHKDGVDKYGGNWLFYVGWDQHLMFCAPLAFLLPPDTPFRALVEDILPNAFGAHPDMQQVDWDKVEWRHNLGDSFQPDLDKTLAEHGFGHKTAIRFRTPGLNGINGCAS